MFRQSINRVVVTSLDSINGWSIQTLLRGETTRNNRMKFMLGEGGEIYAILPFSPSPLLLVWWLELQN